MNLTITQDNTRTETINSSIIDKLYEIAFAASSDPNSTVSLTGRLESPKGYKYKIDWLNTNFSPDLTISTTIGQYMTFYDSNLQNVLKNTIGDGEGVLLNEFQAITNDSQLGLGPNATAHPEITDFREACLLTGLTQFNIGISALTGLTVFGFPPNVTNFSNVFASGLHFDGIVVKNWNNFINRQENSSWWENGYYVYDMDSNGNLTRIDTLTLPSNVTFPNDISWKNHLSGIKLEELVIPAGITRFGLAAGNGIKKISFEPNSTLTTINFGFYLNDNISSSIVQLDVANLPQTITTIGNNAFRSCSNVTGVLDLPNLTSLGQYSFYSTGITSIADLGSITSVSGMCFNNCDSLTTVTLPSSCTNINGGAFAYCDALTSIDLGGTTTIGNQAFIGDSSLTTVTGTSNLTSIGNNAFQSCPITGSVSLPNLVSLGSNAFNNTRITSITDLGSITSIPDNCFFGCTGITSITIPSNVVSIKEHAFSRSGNPITNLQLHSSITNIERGAFAKINYPNSCFYLPLLIGSTSTRDMFSYYYGNGGYMSQIGQLYLPHLINMTTTGYGSYPYWSGLFPCLKAQLIYLKDITDLYPGTFSNSDIQAIVINNTVPPTLNNSTDNRQEEGAYNTAIFNVVNNWSGFIYVPDGYVNTYISAWENVLDSTRENNAGSTIRTDIVLKNRIKSISELPTYATEADWIAANRPLGLITAYMS